MKRERDQVDSITMANYLMMLARGGGGDQFEAITSCSNSSNSRVFECKTCNRQFPSFQALGGHRASHKKPRLMMGSEIDSQFLRGGPPPKLKTHECSICGLEFAIGQALGGHMRRHRAANSNLNGNNMQITNSTTMSSSSGGSTSLDSDSANNRKKEDDQRKRILVLDLNLTPVENDLEFLKIGKGVPLVDYFY